jgi:hypothetical protein
MWKLSNHWRDTQLEWYGGDMLLQDHQLIDFVKNNNIKHIGYEGDGLTMYERYCLLALSGNKFKVL